MNIHGLVYIIIGGFIASFSYYITVVNESLQLEKFMIFILVGIVFVLIGIGKLLMRAAQTKPKQSPAYYDSPMQPAGQQQMNQQRQQSHAHHVQNHAAHRQPTQHAPISHHRPAHHHVAHRHPAHMQAGHTMAPQHLSRYCRSCGTGAHRQARFCSHCGVLL